MQSATIEDSDEQQLARQAIAGDRSALRTLIVRLDPMLRGFLRKLAGQDGEDLAQETWIRVNEQLHRSMGVIFAPGYFRSLGIWSKIRAERRKPNNFRSNMKRKIVPISHFLTMTIVTV